MILPNSVKLNRLLIVDIFKWVVTLYHTAVYSDTWFLYIFYSLQWVCVVI